MEKIRKLFHNFLCYPFLPGALPGKEGLWWYFWCNIFSFVNKIFIRPASSVRQILWRAQLNFSKDSQSTSDVTVKTQPYLEFWLKILVETKLLVTVYMSHHSLSGNHKFVETCVIRMSFVIIIWSSLFLCIVAVFWSWFWQEFSSLLSALEDL